jgi:hypothetical protein
VREKKRFSHLLWRLLFTPLKSTEKERGLQKNKPAIFSAGLHKERIA